MCIRDRNLSYGQKTVPRLRFDKADLIVTIDSDPLGTYLNPTDHTVGFAAGRKRLTGGMNRLIAFESVLSLTGTNADERHVITPALQAPLVLALVHEVAFVQGGSQDSSLKSITASHHLAMSSQFGEAIKSTAKELLQAKGKSLVVAGGPVTETKNSVAVQVAVNLLNSILGNDGSTVDLSLIHI